MNEFFTENISKFTDQLTELEKQFHLKNSKLPKEHQLVLNEIMLRAKNNDITPEEINKLYTTLV